MTSRPHLNDLQGNFGRFPQLEIKARGADIEKFILIRIREEENLLELTEEAPALVNEIVSVITSKANDMSVAFPKDLDN